MTILQKSLFLLSCVPVLFFGHFNYVFADVDRDQATPGSVSNDPATPGTVDADEATPNIQTVRLENPLRINSLEALIVAILNIFITLMIPIIVFFIILAGFKYVTAQGNPSQIEEATTMFTYVIIGGVLILAAVAIAEIIKNTVDSFAA